MKKKISIIGAVVLLMVVGIGFLAVNRNGLTDVDAASVKEQEEPVSIKQDGGSDKEILTKEEITKVTENDNQAILIMPEVSNTVIPTQIPAVATNEPDEQKKEVLVEPTEEPIALDVPTAMPFIVEATKEPEAVPTKEPMISETAKPTLEPTAVPTVAPIITPTQKPTLEPTAVPTSVPTQAPVITPVPTAIPVPTQTPTPVPTVTSTPVPAVVVPEHTHVWDGGSVTVAAMCGADGLKTYSCSCGQTKTEIIAATGAHSPYEDWWYTPTCTTAGYYNIKCRDCGAYLGCQDVAPLAHAYESALINEGSCSSREAYSNVCKDCGFEGPVSYGELKPDKHCWETITSEEWNEETYEWETITGECCKWCSKYNE